MQIKDKVAIVTGGNSGLGLATAQHLLVNGAKVAIFDMNDEVNEELKEYDEQSLLIIKTDVSDESVVATAIDEVYKKFKAIHICVNCAGLSIAQKTYSKRGPFNYRSFKKVIDVNLNGTFNVLRLTAEKMAKNELSDSEPDRGVIINTSSGAAYEGQVGQVAYSASKAAVAGMTLPLARDLASYHIRVNAIAPGLFRTPMATSVPEEIVEKIEAQIEYPSRLGNPQEFATLVIHLIENTYMNGEVVRLDAATRLPPR